MFIPLVVDPHLYRQIATSICQLFSNSVADLSFIDAVSFREIVLGCVLAGGLLEGCLANWKLSISLINASEGWSLFIAFIVLPPLVAVGFYFVFWHGLRHVLRLMKTEQLSFARFAGRAAPATVAALILLGFLGWDIVRHHHNPKFLVVYLALIATLTVPHSVVVAWMDRRDRVY